MHPPLQPQPCTPPRPATLFADIVPLDRRASRGFPQRKALELRDSAGSICGVARFQVRKGRLLVSKFVCRHSETSLGLQLIQFLREEARDASAEEIWLEAKNDAHGDDFYRNCGFQKKGYFREDPEDFRSPEVAIWSLLVTPPADPALLSRPN